MLRNYLIIAWRNLWNNKVFSLINIVGLAVAMASFILILKYVEFELSYENFHANRENIYRISYKQYQDGELQFNRAMSYNCLSLLMHEQIPEVANYCRMVKPIFRDNSITYIDPKGDISGIQEENLFFADSTFFNIFSCKLLEGNPESALSQPNSMLISENVANKLFGDNWKSYSPESENYPLGKTLKSKGQAGTFDCILTGIFENQLSNTHLKIEVLVSHHTLNKSNPYASPWWNNSYNYVLLQEGIDPGIVEAKILDVIPEKRRQYFERTNRKHEYALQPIRDIHLYSNVEGELERNGDIRIVYLFIVIALIILVVAWINYLNLSTIGSLYRRKEMGIRRVVGSTRFQIVTQLIFESLLLNLIAALFAFTLAQTYFPQFKLLANLPGSATLFSIHLVDPLLFWSGIVSIILIGSILSGFYPALLTSSTITSSVLKGGFKENVLLHRNDRSHKGIMVNGLVIFQFVISCILIGATLTIYHQIKFMSEQNLGIDMKDIMVITGPGSTAADTLFDRRKEVFRNKMINISGIEEVAFSGYLPGRYIDYYAVRRQGESSIGVVPVYGGVADPYFFPMLKFEFLAGRNFELNSEQIISKEAFFGYDKQLTVILNEKAVEQLGFDDPESAINEIIIILGKQCRIVGVVNNYNHYSLKSDYYPMLFLGQWSNRGFGLVRMQKSSKELVSTVESNWNQVFPDIPCTYSFLSDSYNSQYKSEHQLSKIVSIFTILAILIAILGLFATTSFTIQRRTKEIGIRKVMGASTRELLRLLSNRIVILVLISGMIAVPIFYVGINSWLQQYAFRIELSWWMFPLPLILLLLLAVSITGYHVFKAAIANPVEALRYE